MLKLCHVNYTTFMTGHAILAVTPFWLLQFYLWKLVVVPRVDPKADAQLVASHLTSWCHATLTTVGSGWILTHPESALTTPTLLLLSSGYFVYDIYYMLRYHYSTMFIVHHLATLSVWYLCLVYQCGWELILYTLFLGEYTNVIRIAWLLAKEFQVKGWTEWLDLGFKYNFLLARCVLAPVHLVYHLPTMVSLPMPWPFRLILVSAALTLLLGSWVWAKRVVHSLFGATPVKTLQLAEQT